MNIERLVKGYYMVICCVHYTRPSWSSDGFNSARKPSVAECAELAGWVGWPDGRVGSPWKPTLSPPRCRNHPWKNRKIPCSTGNMLKTPPHVPYRCRFDILLLQWLCFIWSEGISESDGRRGRLAVRVAMSSEVAPTSCLRTVQRWANKVGGYLKATYFCLSETFLSFGEHWCGMVWQQMNIIRWIISVVRSVNRPLRISKSHHVSL